MNNNSKKITSYVLILASLFILILFTKNYLFDMQANLDLQTTKQKEVEEKRKEARVLQSIKTKLEKWGDIEVEKYARTPTEDALIDYIYSMIEDGNNGKVVAGEKVPMGYGIAKIEQLTFSEVKKNELWFLELPITLDISVASEARLKSILDFFVSQDSKYKFFIDTFSYEKPKTSSTDTSNFIHVSIPLKIFYK